MLGNLRIWVARGLTVLGICLATWGVFSYGFLAFGGAGGSGQISPVAVYLLIFSLVSLPLGVIIYHVGASLQKKMRDEWGPVGFPWRGPSHPGPQKWAKCAQCGGLMKPDTMICPFCGARGTAQSTTPGPLTEDEPAKAGIRATIATDRHWKGPRKPRGKCFVEVERGLLFLEEPGKDPVLIEPRKVLRISSLCLQLDTGFWSDGKVTLTFDSASDADTVEHEARKLATTK